MRTATGGCDSCQVININGHRCHETGCPEAWRDHTKECFECGCDFIPEARYQRICDDCANPVIVGDDEIE